MISNRKIARLYCAASSVHQRGGLLHDRLGVSQNVVIIGKFPQEMFIFLTRGGPRKRARMAGFFLACALLQRNLFAEEQWIFDSVSLRSR